MAQETLEEIIRPLTESEIVEALREKFKDDARLLRLLKKQTAEEFILFAEKYCAERRVEMSYAKKKSFWKRKKALATTPKHRGVEETGAAITSKPAKPSEQDEQATLDALVNWNPENLEGGIPFAVIEYYFGEKNIVTKRFRNEEWIVWPYNFFSYLLKNNYAYGKCRNKLLAMFRKMPKQEDDFKEFMRSYCTVHGRGTILIIKQGGKENDGDGDELSLNLNGEYSLRETANYLGGDTGLVQKLIDSGELTCVSEGVVYGASIARQIRAVTGDYSLLRQLNVCGKKIGIHPDSVIEDAINLAVQKLGLTKEGTPLQAISLEIDVGAYIHVPKPIAAQILNYATRILNVLIPSQEYNLVVKALECMDRILEQYITGTGSSLESMPENLLSGLSGVVKRHFNKFSKQISVCSI